MHLAPGVLTAITLSATLACSGGAKKVDPAIVEAAAIRTADSSWNQFLQTQNDSAIAALYVADAVLMPPNMPRVVAASAIRSFWAQIWPIKASLVLTPGTIQVTGDRALEEGNWTWSAPTPKGEQKDNGKYLVSWQKIGGNWKVVQHMWNSDNPPPTPAK
jgi:ketosteroid isomerase-like protein